ncbi:bifunctional non-homologous end joining protein LigD [Ensifer sp. 4252]
MPDRVEPCLALLVEKVPCAGDWAFEIKWDGYRLAVHVEPSGVRILTRGGHDWTHRFPTIEAAAKALGPSTMILDGAAVVLDDVGRSSFGMLQAALGGRGGKRVASEALFYAFDLLHLDGHDLRGMDQRERRMILEETIEEGTSIIRVSEEIEGEGAAIQSDNFVVGGFESSTKAPGAISRLLLAADHGGELVGTGFTDKMARDLCKQLSAMPAKVPRSRSSARTLCSASQPLLPRSPKLRSPATESCDTLYSCAS